MKRPDVLRIGTSEADIARVYPWLDEVAEPNRLPEKLLYSMHVALEEAVMNVVLHGYGSGEAGEVNISYQASAAAAVLEIADHGREFDPVTAEVPNRAMSLAEAKPGGLGLGLLRHHCPDLRYQRDGGRNLLTLVFPLQS
jgi:anti-sigma regulatory factor (Ser/Thr protein kinase)